MLAIAKVKMVELGLFDQFGKLTADKSKSGMIMSVLMKELKGKADGAVVKEAVDSLLTN